MTDDDEAKAAAAQQRHTGGIAGAGRMKGYRDLTMQEFTAVDGLKVAEEHVLRTIESLKELPMIDGRWVAIGTTHIQEGFMALIRSVTRPNRITLTEDEEPHDG